MMKYILVLLLINTYSCGWGSPVDKTGSNGKTENTNLGNSLHLLATNCHDRFISSQIQKQSVCNDLQPQENKNKFKCLLFYDINSQLCSNPSVHLVLKDDDYTTRINEKYEVEKFCVSTALWPVSDLKEYPDYLGIAKKIFGHPKVCEKFCGTDDIFNDNVNFFCKYFKWGVDVLKEAQTQINNSSTAVKDFISLPSSKSNIGQSNIVVPKTDINNINIVSQNDNLTKKLTDLVHDFGNEVNAKSNIESPPERISDNGQMSGPELINGNLAEQDGLISQQLGETGSQQPTKSLAKPINSGAFNESKKINAPFQLSENDNMGAESSSRSTATNKGIAVDKPEGHQKLQDIKQEDIDDDSVPDVEAKEDRSTLQEDDNDSELEEKINPGFEKEKIELPPTFEREPNQREISAVIPDSFTEDDDDDHFFSLFLTGVILVILLYVLYHNKNKVSKVVMGLIVEGRAGRRRNSRGHAYRRLDTLEQAVNASHPAPPAKIIY